MMLLFMTVDRTLHAIPKAIVAMLFYYETGVVGIIIVLIIGLFGGILHNFFDVHTGIEFYTSG